MKNEEIEAARRSITLAIYGSSQIQADDARLHLDALCAAAREPDSLVGRRVRVPKINNLEFVIISDPRPHYTAKRSIHALQNWDLLRDDFELLEDDDAE